ncbi:hypothetical protein AB0M97_29265 [Streptomyces sp. NPDC051207]|uniref:hypothetical protein n=1 Tax=Streptomyces sp. NPDC051207 TaxID=3154641 RepID=UPI0034489133
MDTVFIRLLVRRARPCFGLGTVPVLVPGVSEVVDDEVLLALLEAAGVFLVVAAQDLAHRDGGPQVREVVRVALGAHQPQVVHAGAVGSGQGDAEGDADGVSYAVGHVTLVMVRGPLRHVGHGRGEEPVAFGEALVIRDRRGVRHEVPAVPAHPGGDGPYHLRNVRGGAGDGEPLPEVLRGHHAAVVLAGLPVSRLDAALGEQGAEALDVARPAGHADVGSGADRGRAHEAVQYFLEPAAEAGYRGGASVEHRPPVHVEGAAAHGLGGSRHEFGEDVEEGLRDIRPGHRGVEEVLPLVDGHRLHGAIDHRPRGEGVHSRLPCQIGEFEESADRRSRRGGVRHLLAVGP